MMTLTGSTLVDPRLGSALDLDGVDYDIGRRTVLRAPLHLGNLVCDVLAFHHLAENRMVAGKPGRGGHGDKKLASVGSGPGIRHGQFAGLVEFMRGALGLVLEFVSRAAHAGAAGIAALDHEVGNHAVKNSAAIKRSGAALPAHAVLPWAIAFGQINEVLGGDGSIFVKQAANDLAFTGVKHR